VDKLLAIMSPAALIFSLPDANSSSLHLAHPTPEEKAATWKLNSAAWGRALSLESYIKREEHMMNAPLAKNGGITYWVLVDKNVPPNERVILASCESIRKPALVGKDGSVVEVVSHGIGSVFCNPAHRGRGYASRMMAELGKTLQTWQIGGKKMCMFSVLWSDIGKGFYTTHGWNPFPSTHIEFPADFSHADSPAKALELRDLEKLCEGDVASVRRTIVGSRDGKTRVAIVPNFEQMKWHHVREDYMCQHVLGRKPTVRGAIIGEPGHRVWANWSRTFYGPLEGPSGNTLHILRLVIEDEVPSGFLNETTGPNIDSESLERLAKALRAVLEAAQAEAAKSRLLRVELWNPSPLVQVLVKKTGLVHGMVEREKDSISCLMWYGEGSGNIDEIEWIGNEKYGWN
jgi:GNAT superfamily N-acetyltransferase